MITIRSALEEDFESYVAVRDAAWAQAYGHLLPASTYGPASYARLRELWPGRIHDSLGFFLVEVEGRVSGYATVVKNVEEDVPADTMLAALYVHPEAQGRGLGRLLTYACAHRSQREGATMAIAAFEANTAARAIYRGWGGESIGFGTYAVQGEDYPDERFVFRDLNRLRERLFPLDLVRLTAEDAPSITPLVRKAYARHEAQGLRFLATYQEDEITAERIDGSEAYGLRWGNDWIATLCMKFNRSPKYGDYEADGRLASFSQFAVDPGFQGLGLAQRMLAWVESECLKRGIPELACDTAAPALGLIEFYRRLGYVPVGRADWRPVTNYESVILAKRLRPA